MSSLGDEVNSMICWYSPYRLDAHRAIGCRAASMSRLGVLLKIEYPEIGIGYADCHPWPELGDEPLERQISLLAQGTKTNLTSRSTQFAKEDAWARSRGVSLFGTLGIPPSHYLISDPDELDGNHLEQIAEQGFSRIKLKMGRRLQKEIERLISLKKVLEQFDLRLRLDFNGCLTIKALDEFLAATTQVIHLLDWIEDPMPFTPQTWMAARSKSGIRFALDRGSDETTGFENAADVLILKPSVQSPEVVFARVVQRSMRLCVTSYMDHPVGQAFAAYTAGRIFSQNPTLVENCGLLSHRIYKETSFSREIESFGPVFSPPGGTGIGFDELLNSLEWKILK